MSRLSVIVPVHNEGKNLAKNIRELELQLKKSFSDFEIIISEDGSTDNTADISRSLRSPNIKTLNNLQRLGKGAAIKLAAAASVGEVVVFMDADLASHPSYCRELVRLVDGGADLVVGSRYLKGAKAKRSISRLVASRSFNFLVKLLLGSKISDHQCGFKAFRKELVVPIADEIEDNGWFWDTELLVRAQRGGLKVVEVPIEWNEAPESQFRLINDSLNMAYRLARFKLKNG